MAEGALPGVGDVGEIRLAGGMLFLKHQDFVD